jgi:hypothetical protein
VWTGFGVVGKVYGKEGTIRPVEVGVFHITSKSTSKHFRKERPCDNKSDLFVI